MRSSFCFYLLLLNQCFLLLLSGSARVFIFFIFFSPPYLADWQSGDPDDSFQTFRETMPDESQPVVKQEEHEAAGLTSNIRLPTFWRADPELWFVQAEAVFATCKVNSSKSKFQFVIPYLDYEILKNVADIVKTPTDTPYESLKSRLISIYAESENTRIRKLLEDRRLSEGEKPSHFLTDLRRLAGSSISQDLLRSIWERALPERMQATLAVTAEKDLEKLAAIADRIAEVYEFSGSGQVSAAHASTSRDHQASSLQEQVAKLTRELNALRGQLSNHNRGRSKSRDRNRSKSRDREWCYYHNRYRERAKKCRSPCSWKDSKKQGNDRQ